MITYDDFNRGFHTAKYFQRAAVATADEPRHVKMQFFQRKEDTVLAGMADVLRLLNSLPGIDQLVIRSLEDGDIVQPWEPVLTIEGSYHLFAIVESPILGILARCSRVATNMHRLVGAAQGTPVYFFGDRFDIPEAQAYDGYAAAIGGASAVCTDAMWAGSWFKVPNVGTMPHALIAFHGGDVVKACRAFRDAFPDVPMHALVDFNNDSVGDSLRCLREFGKDLAGVRLDTGGALMDESLARLFESNGESIDRLNPATRGDDSIFRGVNPYLVGMVRKALDDNGGQHVKITVSGGFNVDKVRLFREKYNAPVDVFAVGSSVVTQNPIDYTADLVWPAVKVGRSEQDDSRLTER